MESVVQFQRYEHAYNLLNSEFLQLKDDFQESKRETSTLAEENRKLRKDLKDSLENKLDPSDIEFSTGNKLRHFIDHNDRDVIANLENQLSLMRKERQSAMDMWQNSLSVISNLEAELKNLQFHTAPQTMSFEIELKRRQEEFARSEAAYYKEISILKTDLAHREEELNDARLKHSEFRVEIENLNSLINQKNLDKRNLIQKEYGYDDALISLQNDINDLETKNISYKKDNQYLKEVLQEYQARVNEQQKTLGDLEHRNGDLKEKLGDALEGSKQLRDECKKMKLVEDKNRADNVSLNRAIEELMEEAAMKTQKEVQELKKVYNANLEKLMNECQVLESDQSSRECQLEKVLRAKKSLEVELEKITLENQRVTNKENSLYEDLHRRFCTIEREKEQALQKLDAKETELKQLKANYENDKQKNEAIISDFTEKSYIARRDLERLSDEHSRTLTVIDELKEKIGTIDAERNALQKRLTKEIEMRESELKVKSLDSFNKVKVLEETQGRALFELRQLLNVQQRMANKWKEECHTITSQSEAKFSEMRKNFENLKQNNEKLTSDLRQYQQSELQSEKTIGIYMNKIRTLESRVKDAETQAVEATKRVARQVARDKMLSYEKHLMESNMARNNFQDTFIK